MGKNSSKIKMMKAAIIGLYVIGFFSVMGYFLFNNQTPVLSPEGTIADQQRSLLILATALMLLVVVPVFILTFFIVWKYRATNKKKVQRDAEWDHSRVLEAIWWGFPCLIIAVLAVYTFISSHELDPFRKLDHSKQPITVQVVALQWKWLFIYPDQKIASVNEVRFPEKTPVNFQITSDAPMNSFWIPSLGGQVYAMSGMTTKLHLMADKTGTYKGSSANISGEGFAGMKFSAQSVSDTDFTNWVQAVKRGSDSIDVTAYNQLASPSKNNPVKTYRLADEGLYDKIINKYMGHDASTEHSHDKNTEEGH